MTEIHIDQLIRSRRRSISLSITRDARLIVRAPVSVSESYIQQVVSQKHRWIKQKLDFFRSKPLQPPKTFKEGEVFLYLGNSYALEIHDDLEKAVVFDGTLKISAHVLNNAKDHMLLWYKEQALNYISARVHELAQIYGLSYVSVKVNSAKTRWGSCGYKGSLNFAWKLIMAPSRVIDYVIIHELMHLIHRNHSSKFWNAVSARVPDYLNDEAWLNQNNHLLTL